MLGSKKRKWKCISLSPSISLYFREHNIHATEELISAKQGLVLAKEEGEKRIVPNTNSVITKKIVFSRLQLHNITNNLCADQQVGMKKRYRNFYLSELEKFFTLYGVCKLRPLSL